MIDKTFSVAVIGGICTGKSAFSENFSAFGAEVLSADRFVHQLLGQEVYQAQIRELFQMPSKTDFSLSYVRQSMLEDKNKRTQLEQLLHPEVTNRIEEKIKKSSARYCVVEMPLYVEINCPLSFDRVLLIDVPENLQIERLKNRKITESQAKEFISIQSIKKDRYHVAHEIIWNTIAYENITNVVKRLHMHYQTLSAMA